MQVRQFDGRVASITAQSNRYPGHIIDRCWQSISEYTTRQTSYAGDSLNALRSVQHFFLTKWPDLLVADDADLIKLSGERQAGPQIDGLQSAVPLTISLRYVYGLPFLQPRPHENHMAPALAHYLANRLCWFHSNNIMRESGVVVRRHGFPSWTWVGWQGAAQQFLVANFNMYDEVVLPTLQVSSNFRQSFRLRSYG